MGYVISVSLGARYEKEQEQEAARSVLGLLLLSQEASGPVSLCQEARTLQKPLVYFSMEVEVPLLVGSS